MIRVYKLTIAVGEYLPRLSKRSFSATKTTYSSWNPVKYSQNLDVGRQAFRVYAVEMLIDQHPDLSASEVNDVANGLMHPGNMLLLKLKDSAHVGSDEKGGNDVLAKIGELKRKNDTSSLHHIFEEVKDTCLSLSLLSPQSTKTLIKSQHPRFLLRHFCDLENINLHISSKHQHNGSYLSSVYFEGENICRVKGAVRDEAVDLACFSTIQQRFVEQFDKIQLKDFDEIPLEHDVDIGEKHLQRVVNIIKVEDAELGFTIRGGQQKVIKNKDYIQVSIITPIIISDVIEASPAAAAGLRKGDVLIGVNDHNLTDKVHEQAVISLKKVVSHEEISLTVIHNKHELLKYEAEQKILERELDRVKDEIKSTKFRRWHESKSKMDPMEYFMEKFVEKKRKYQHKPGGKKNRLWHQYKSVAPRQKR